LSKKSNVVRPKPNSVCLICDKSFYCEPYRLKKGEGKYCSSSCQHRGLQVTRKKRICLTCSKSHVCKESDIARGRGKYCSRTCHFRRKSLRKIAECVICGTLFRIKPYEIRHGRQCCSRKCGYALIKKRTLKKTHKRCYRCGLKKLLKEFHANKFRKDGRSDRCKTCKANDEQTEEYKNVRNQNRRQSYKNNPEKAYIYAANRQARRQGAPYEHITPSEIYLRDGGICQICRKKVPIPGKLKWADPRAPTLDHIVPVSHPDFVKVGHVRTNVRLAHFGCNSSRNNRPRDAQYLLFG
jgi:hypothetical protein